MDERRASDERLPWLDSAPAKANVMPAAARRSRTPLLILLALFVTGAIAVMAFLAGRTTAPVPAGQVAPPLIVRLPDAPPPPVETNVAAPAPTASSASAPRSAARATAKNVPKRAVRRYKRPDRRGMVPQIERAFPLAPIGSATPRDLAEPAPPPVTAPTPAPTPRPAPPSVSAPQAARPPAAFARGGVVQLGAYVSMPLLNSAWSRLYGAYPYLGTLPRMVTGTALPGRPYYYRLRVAAGSSRQANALCNRLHRIGRGCMVIRS